MPAILCNTVRKKEKKNAACQLREKRKIVLQTDVVEVGDMNL